MRDERLDEELPKDTVDGLDLLVLSSLGGNPLLCLWPCLVQCEKTALASSLDELIWLCDKLAARDEQPRVLDFGLVKNILDVLVLWEVKRCESCWGVVCGSRWEGCWLDDGSSGKVVVEDGLAVGLEDGLCGHDEVGWRV